MKIAVFPIILLVTSSLGWATDLFTIVSPSSSNDGGKGTIGLYCIDENGVPHTWRKGQIDPKMKIDFDKCIANSAKNMPLNRSDSGSDIPLPPEIDLSKPPEEVTRAYQKLYCSEVLKKDADFQNPNAP